MAPRKNPPHPSDLIRNMMGITFSIEIVEQPAPAYGYTLQPAVHKINSSSLIKRMNRMNRVINSKAKKIERKPKMGKKRKVAQHTASIGECLWCKCHKTAQWRKGPTGARSLCNRCGIEWAKHIRIEARTKAISNIEAEAELIRQFQTGERFQKYQKTDEYESPADSGQNDNSGDSTAE
ncbi:blue light receptor [Boothiomyces macroporosus]|uniref:Blue light receptor n=1 Tax=Boothiomyces macroporosus TaxID=261099 RepID=A0AAD5UEZ7_9FUNG|nr:blue light receptor [Boothiomyces macroporosus]